MTIIKHGDPPDTTTRFTCGVCGCVFEAEKTEYDIAEVCRVRFRVAECPDCGENVAADADAVIWNGFEWKPK